MKKLFIILTFNLCLLTSLIVKSAYAQTCDSFPQPEIHFSTSYGKLHYDFKHSTEEITVLSKRYGHGEQGIFLSGLATVSIEKEFEVGAKGKHISPHNICVYPAVINVFIGLSEPTIYISRNLEPDSCEYNLVLRHEQTHQIINKKTLDYFLPHFRLAAQKIATEIKPILVHSSSDMASVTQQMTNDFARRMNKVIRVFEKELGIEQGKLDNKENYQFETDTCLKYKKTHLH